MVIEVHFFENIKRQEKIVERHTIPLVNTLN
jgi:hypothetical protein